MADAAKRTIADRIREAEDDRIDIVSVDEWGVKIQVRSMSDRESNAWLKATRPDGLVDWENSNVTLLLRTCFDPETGEAVFTPNDLEWLKDKNAGPVNRLAVAAMRLSGLNTLAGEEEGAKERAGKGS